MPDSATGLKIHPAIYLLFGLLLLSAAYVVFRRIVRKDYRRRGHLTAFSSALQLLIFAGIMGFPYLYNPPEWPWFWIRAETTDPRIWYAGMGLILVGFVISFGTMGWFGMQRAFGFVVKGLVTTGPYRFTRNPQILGGYLLIIGVVLQWPSWYALIWIILYALTGHWMILTEEEHLQAIFGDEYRRYSKNTPRYLFRSSSQHL